MEDLSNKAAILKQLKSIKVGFWLLVIFFVIIPMIAGVVVGDVTVVGGGMLLGKAKDAVETPGGWDDTETTDAADWTMNMPTEDMQKMEEGAAEATDGGGEPNGLAGIIEEAIGKSEPTAFTSMPEIDLSTFTEVAKVNHP